MGSFYLILALVFSLLIAIMAVANNEVVTVSYIFGRAEVSLIVLILGSAFTGALVMGLFSLFRAIKTAFAFREARRRCDELQKEVRSLEEEKIYLEAELNRAVSSQNDEDDPGEEERDPLPDMPPPPPVAGEEERGNGEDEPGKEPV